MCRHCRSVAPRLGPSTFEEMWAQNSAGLLRFFARRTMDPEAAMDLVAETFAAAFVSRRRFRGSTQEEVSAFLHGIARRQLWHWYRSGVAQRRAMARLGLERPALDDDAFARIEELAGIATQRTAMQLAMAALREDQRAVLQLRIVEERGYADLASRLGVSEQTARARVSRALRALSLALVAAEGTA